MIQKKTTILLWILAFLIHYAYGASIQDSDLLVLLRFEETSGTTTANSSTSYPSYYGNINQTSLVTKGVQGVQGNAFSFTSASANSISMAGGYSAPVNTFSFGGWIKTSVTHEIDGETISGVGGISGQRYAFQASHGGEGQSITAGVGMSIGTNGISVYEHAGSYMPAVSVYNGSIGSGWNHVMVVVSNRVSKIYLNGALVHTGLTTNRTTLLAPSAIGTSSYTSLSGSMDEVNIWKKALTATEIQDIYTNGFDGVPALTAQNTNFGNVRVGTSASASVTVTNSGQPSSTLTGTIGAASGSEFSPTSGTESFSLGQNQSSSRTFTYTPNARGTDSTIVSVNSNASNTSRTLTGTGVSPVYSSSVAPDSAIDFGIVDKDQTVTRSLTIQNLTPDADLGNLTNMTLLSATISGEGASSYSLGGFTPGTVLSKGMSLNLLLSITNLDHLVRTRNATLTIVTDENAALGETGNVYTYQLVAYTVPEPSSCIFLTLAIVFFAFQGKKNFHRFLR